MKKRVLSLFLAITLCLSLTPTGALAEESLPGQTVAATQETETPTRAPQKEEPLPEQTVAATQETEPPTPAPQKEESTAPAENGADENASPASPDEKPTENTPAAPEKNPADEEPGKEPAAATGKDESKADGSPSDDDAAKVQNQLVMAAAAGPGEPTMMGQNNLLALADEGQTPANAQNSEGGGIYVPPGGPTEGGGGTYIPGEDTRTEIWCVSRPDSIGRSYDGTTDGGRIPINLTFTDGTNEIEFKEGTDFTAKKTFDSADAGWHTVTVEITLIGETAKKYKLKAGEEKFEIGGNINKAYPDLTVSLSRATCAVGEKLLPLLSVSGVKEDAAVTYYYTQYKTIAGDSEYEGSEAIPKIDENTVIDKLDEEGNNTYYVYAKTAATKNYNEGISDIVELTVSNDVASVTTSSGVTNNYTSLDDALNAAQDGDTVKLLADHTTNWSDVEAGEYATLAVVKKTLTLDLNGMTVDYLTVGEVVPDEEGGILETFYGNLTVVDNIQGGSHGKIKDLEFVQGSLAIQGGQIGDSNGGGLTCNEKSGSVTISGGTVLGLQVGEGADVTVNSGSAHAGAWLNDGTLNITGGTFGDVRFRNNGGTIAISGGKFGTITNHDASSTIPLMPLLANGYAFYKDNVVQDATAKNLTDVTVGAHTHTPDENGKCACGASIIASVKTADGTERTYGSFTDALAAAVESNDSTLQLLYDIDLGDTKYGVSVDSGKFTLDLNSKTLSGKVDYQLLTVSGTADITIKNGKFVNTFSNDSPAMNRGLANAIQITGGTAVLENVEVTSGCGENGEHTDAVCLSDGNLTVANGTFTGAILVMPKTADQHPVLKITSATLHNGIGYFIWNTSNPDYDGVKALFADGSLLFDKDGNYIDITNAAYWQTDSSEEESFTATIFAYGEECSVKPHTHTIVNGKCSVCGEVEGDGCIAHAVWSPYADYPQWRTTHIKTMDELREKITSPGTNWLDFDNNVTVTFLCDVTVDKTFLIDNYYTNIIIDLNGHTLSGALDGPVITANFVPGTGTIDFKNGKIVNTGNGEAIRLAKGKVTLENVDVTGDLSLTYDFVNSLSYIPTFLGGGSFTKICTVNDAGGWQKFLEDMLPKGYYFADITSGKRVSQTVLNADSPLENVTVKPCNHKDADGKSTFTYKPERQTYYYCSICGNICPHEHRTELADGSLHCEDCNLTLTAARRDSKNTIAYYIDMSDAFGNAYQPIIWPLCDQTCTQAAMTYYGSNTIDLNGFTVTANNSSGVLFAPYVSAYKMTLQNSAENQGHYVCEYLQVYNDGTLAIPAENNNLTISAVLIKSDGNANLAGGSFGKISVEGEKTLAGLLVSGYYFADTASGEPAAMYDADGTALTELTNVTVQPCSHDTAVCGSDGVWKCLCGQNVFVASVTKDGTPTYYTDLQNAFSAADGNTVKLMANVRDVTVSTDKPFTFDLNGYNVEALSVDAKATIKDSGTTKGRIGKVTVSNEKVTDLTLGDLLEEGYAFQYETGYWADDSHKETISGLKVTVEKAPIQSVKIYAKDKNHKEVPTTMAYGTTGEVTLVSSCRMGETSGADLSYLWYKLEGAAATAPLEGATGANYTLPDNLTAGTHTYLLICTSGGYSKSAEITVTVTPVSLAGADVTVQSPTYNGKLQEPKVTVKLGDKTLSRDNDYSMQVTKQTDAGSYKLTIKGRGNYTDEIKDMKWKIEPMKIDSVMVSSDISKTYDGTATVTKTAEEWAKVLTFKTLSAYDVVSVPSDAYTISDAYFVEKSGEETIYSPDAGEKYGISFKITLKSNNYVLQTYGEDTPSTSKVITQSGGATFAIAQAAAPTDIQTGTLNVVNGTTLEYTYDAKQLLPDAPKGTYGNVSYNCRFTFNLKNGYYVDDIAIDDSVLTLTIAALSGRETGKIGTIPIYITTDNYESFDLPLDLYAVDKITPVVDGDITASNITYSDELSKSTISGKMKSPTTGDEVKGTFAWTDGTIKPDANDNYEAEWTFTPAAGYEKYATATGTVTIKVNKATPAFTAPTAQENLTYTGQEQALIIAGSTQDGTMKYRLGESGEFVDSIPNGKDAGTYTVYYKVVGDENHNDTAPASVTVRIGQKPLRITGVTAASKTYDGTTNADITSVTFENVTLNRGTDYTVTASFDDASVGNDKNITATVTLTEQGAKNYALEQNCFFASGSITKAAAPGSGLHPAVTVINDLAKTYEMVLSNDYLPELSSPCEYGNVSYSLGGTQLMFGYKAVQAEVVEENSQYKLKLTVPAVDYNKVSSVGTLWLYVSSDNYQDFRLDIGVRTKNKDVPVPDGTITASDITYGQALNDSKIAGKMKAGGRAIDGTFAWKNGTFKPNAGDYTASWTFTPDAPEYATATGIVTVTVNPKAVTVSGITAKDKVYDGNTDAVLDCSKVTLNGVLENDTLTVTATGTFGSANAGKQKVKISGLELSGASAANYVPSTEDSQTETTATITAKEATVTPDNKTKAYEEKDPDLTYAVSGVLDGETLKGITLTRAEGENAGEYAITGTADAGANPNYEVTFAEGKFTIDPKSIDGATVVLGKGLIANGAEQTQTVEKVLLDGKELPADSYTVTDNTATAPGKYTLTITAKGNYTDFVEQTYAIAPAKAEDAPSGSGKVNVDVQSEGAVPPAALLTDKAELPAMLVDSGDITAEELAQIADGASVDIVLTVKEANVSDEVKAAMAQAAKGSTIGHYLDISLFKYMTVNGSQQAGVALHTTRDALTISVVVPDALINTNSAVIRTYYIVRNHEGTITVLDAAFDAANKTLTFKTDRFSDYAIAYKDTAVPGSGSNSGSNPGSNPDSSNSSNDSETKKNEVTAPTPTPTPTPASTSKPSTITAAPQTGDTSNPTLYVVLLVASLLGLAVVFVCKKRNDK